MVGCHSHGGSRRGPRVNALQLTGLWPVMQCLLLLHVGGTTAELATQQWRHNDCINSIRVHTPINTTSTMPQGFWPSERVVTVWLLPHSTTGLRTYHSYLKYGPRGINIKDGGYCQCLQLTTTGLLLSLFRPRGQRLLRRKASTAGQQKRDGTHGQSVIYGTRRERERERETEREKEKPCYRCPPS